MVEPVDISVNVSSIPNHSQFDVYVYMNHFLHNLHGIKYFSFVNLIDDDEERLELLLSSYNRLSYVFFVIPRIIEICLYRYVGYCTSFYYIGFSIYYIGFSFYYIGSTPTLDERQYRHH